MVEDLCPDFGPEISLEEAMQKLEAWCIAGTKHAFAFNGRNEGAIE